MPVGSIRFDESKSSFHQCLQGWVGTEFNNYVLRRYNLLFQIYLSEMKRTMALSLIIRFLSTFKNLKPLFYEIV
jgi:hypothetical protein